MQRLFRVTISFFLVMLAACSSYQNYVNSEKELKACRIKCYTIEKKCNATCVNNCNNCSTLAYAQSANRFKMYKHRQLVQGKIVALELQSFKDPLQCRKTTCSCKKDLRVCLQACSGKIYKNFKVVAVC